MADSRCRALTINDLPDDDLLAIFDFYVVKLRGRLVDLVYCDYDTKKKIESWQTLVHVCRRWRGLVLGSPSRLNLQLCCTPETPVRMSLDVWPALPLVILGHAGASEASTENMIAKLEYSDRITQIQIDLHRYLLRTEDLWTAMEVPFPELEVFRLSFGDMCPGQVLPDLLLGGSAPRLRYLTLFSISFPGLPNLLLFATQLVHLSLSHYSGSVSPQVMATCLSTLTSLESFQLDFAYPRDQDSLPPPPTRFVLPALTQFWFRGPNKYLEDLVSRIDAPRLYQLVTTFFNDVDLDTSELSQFIGRTLRFETYNDARLIFHTREARIRLQSHPEPSDDGKVEVIIPCGEVLRQKLSSLAQICTTSFRLLSTAENLYIYENIYQPPVWKGDIEHAVWLRLLLPFTAAKNLYLSKKIGPRIAPALQELTGGRTTEALPALQNIFLERTRFTEPVQEDIARFIDARQFTNYPVTVSPWEK